MMQQTVAAPLHIFKGIFGELLFKLHTGILFCVILLDPDTMGLIPILGMILVFYFTSHFFFFFFLLLFFSITWRPGRLFSPWFCWLSGCSMLLAGLVHCLLTWTPPLLLCSKLWAHPSHSPRMRTPGMSYNFYNFKAWVHLEQE